MNDLKHKKIIRRLCHSAGIGIIAVCTVYIFSSCGSGPQTKTTDPENGPCAIQFPGIEALGFYNYVNANDGASMSSGDFTVEAWIKTSASGTIISRENTTGGFILYAGTTFAFFRIDTSSSTSKTATSTVAVNDGIWHHIAGVLVGEAHNHASTTSCTAQARAGIHIDLYVDGAWQNCAGPFNPYPDNLDGCDTCKNYIGRESNDVFSIPPFNGILDEVRVWKEARTASQIEYWRHFEIPDINRAAADPNGALAGYWKFNDCTGSRAADSSGSGWNGTKYICLLACSTGNAESLSAWTGGWVAGYPF